MRKYRILLAFFILLGCCNSEASKIASDIHSYSEKISEIIINGDTSHFLEEVVQRDKLIRFNIKP